MKKIILIFLFILNFINSFAQRTCGMKGYMNRVMTDPILKQDYLQRQAVFEVEYQRILNQDIVNNANRGLQTPMVTKIIPVAVHFPTVSNTSSASIKACLRALAQSQINVINADYNAANSDISNWASASSYYPGVTVGNLDVQFVLATQNHPAGTGLTNGMVAVTFGTDFLTAGNPDCTNGCNSDATWAGYMNFVVKNIGAQLLGYSPLQGYPNAGDAVVMNSSCFGKGTSCVGFIPQSPFNLGRTVTHELGHFFNLDHTFNGCGEQYCYSNSTDGLGDGVCDTPSVGSETYGCPTNGSIAGCISGQKSLTMNFMDYVDDACMYMFTNGQKTRALASINTIYSQFNTNTLSNIEVNTIDFKVFPNPSTGIVNIQLSNLNIDFTVEVYDLIGREVSYTIINNGVNKAIQLNTASKGIYYITINADNKLTSKKIVIE